MARWILLAATVCFVATSASAKTRVWIDTDPACGLSAMSDPDDCFAVLYLLAAPSIEIAGISTTFGNASVEETTGVANELLRRWRAPHPRVFPGAGGALSWWHPSSPTRASRAIAAALDKGPLTFVALGPLTNLATALRERTNPTANLTEVVAVMGKKAGEIFHPAEGSPDALLGHGPAFSDLNFAKDPRAAASVFAAGAPVTLVPYAAGKTQSITRADLARLAALGGAPAWVSQEAHGWLDFWRDVVGRDGFYPFDLVAAIVVGDRRAAICKPEFVVLKHDDKIGWFGFGPRSLLFSPPAPGAFPVSTCRALSVRAADRLADATASAR